MISLSLYWDEFVPGNPVVLITLLMTMSPFFVVNFPILTAAEEPGLGKLDSGQPGGQGCWAGRCCSAARARSHNLRLDEDLTEG